MNRPERDRAQLRHQAHRVLSDHWRAEGYTMPNGATYPWQWLWDSCFHSIVWCELGDERALTELDSLFALQTPSGFVPHMTYHPDPAAAEPFWGRRGASTITQPPMYGHTIAELTKRGRHPGDRTVEAAVRGLTHLFEHRRRTPGGLIELSHPWESGCDDSARWDGALAGGWHRESWRAHKHRLVASVATDADGGAIGNDAFAVGSVGFCALVAFNAFELDRAVGAPDLRRHAAVLVEAIAARWSADLRTWVDDGALATTSGRVRTTDALFALLVDDTPARVDAVAADLVDPVAYGARFGPTGAHRAEPSFDPVTYWRGPAWPQMTYLLWVALGRHGRAAEASRLADGLLEGALESGFAEFWHPDTGRGGGAIPQSWATLAVLVDNVAK